jgi:prepilin-type N-terminal cleavage/methylation domain-containing protein
MFAARRQGQAFTLIEMMVVAAIMALLVGIFLVIVKGAMTLTVKTTDLNLVKNIETGINAFHADAGTFPPSPNTLPAGTASLGNGCDGTQWLGTCLLGQVNVKINLDPVTGSFVSAAVGAATGYNANGRHFGPYLPPDPKFVVPYYLYYTKANNNAPYIPWAISIAANPALVDARGTPILYYAANQTAGAGSIWGSSTSYRFNSTDNTGGNVNLPPGGGSPTLHGFGAPKNILQYEPIFANGTNGAANQTALGGAQYLLFAAGADSMFCQTTQQQFVNGGYIWAPVDNRDDILVWGP